MGKLYNLARMSTATTGTGTITLGSAVSGYLSFANAGVANGDVVDYAIKDGANSEIGTGTYTSAGTTLTRTVTKSTNSNSAINLSGNAEVFITPRAETLNDASLFTTGTLPAARLSFTTSEFNTALSDGDMPTAATQSDQETSTSTTTFVTPGRQQYHPSAAKCWCKWGVTTTIDASFNMSSITDNGSGDWTLNINVDFSSANYAVSYTSEYDFATYGQQGCGWVKASGQAAGTLRMQFVNDTNTAYSAFDPTKNYVIMFGDQ